MQALFHLPREICRGQWVLLIICTLAGSCSDQGTSGLVSAPDPAPTETAEPIESPSPVPTLPPDPVSSPTPPSASPPPLPTTTPDPTVTSTPELTPTPEPTPTPTPEPTPEPTPTPELTPTPTATPAPTPTPVPTATPAPTPTPPPTVGGFGCISTSTGDVATSRDLDALLSDVPSTLRPSQLFVTLSGEVTWTQGIATDPAIRLAVFFVDPERGDVNLNIDRFVPDNYSASEVGCGGATQPGGTCNFNLPLPIGALSISGPGDYKSEFTFFDAGGSSYTCTKSFVIP